MNFNPYDFPYPSRRNPVYASRGMVATAHPLAAAAGLDVLKKGGNAVDAAIATAATLTVVEPTSNGIGSDCFVMIWKKGKLYGLNGSGPAPQGLTAEPFCQKGLEKLPLLGWPGVTVPAAPAVWAELTEKMGRLSLQDNLAIAENYAREGHSVAPTVALCWQQAFEKYSGSAKGPEFEGWFHGFAPQGRAPRPGELWHNPDQARTLQLIGSSNAREFYEGSLANQIVAHSDATGGYLQASDLANFRPHWVQPLSVDYRGYHVWEMPPNGQGLVALLALSILRGFEFSNRGIDTSHRQIEAIKMAFADAMRHVADPDFAAIPLEELLSEDYAASRRATLSHQAQLPRPGQLAAGGTVYLCTADAEGTMVSYIQSNFHGFGSAIVVPGTGISLNNRAIGFSLDPSHPNVLAPGKRPYCTIIPGFLTKDDEAVGPFGVMGCMMQPQGHVQVLMNAIDFGLNPQQALDAPRWQWINGLDVEIEPGYDLNEAQLLQERGHHMASNLSSLSFGRGQIIWRNPEGTYTGATEPRADGSVAAW